MKASQRNEFLQDMWNSATKEELMQAEEVNKIIRTVPMQTLFQFMEDHPEYEVASMNILRKYMEVFTEDSFMQAALYVAATFYYKFHK